MGAESGMAMRERPGREPEPTAVFWGMEVPWDCGMDGLELVPMADIVGDLRWCWISVLHGSVLRVKRESVGRLEHMRRGIWGDDGPDGFVFGVVDFGFVEALAELLGGPGEQVGEGVVLSVASGARSASIPPRGG